MSEISGGGIGSAAVIGAGVIGFSWAHLYCRNGVETRLYDPDPEALRRGYDNIVEALDLFVSLDLLDTTSRDAAEARLHRCESIEDAVSGADWVHENAPEDLALKQDLFQELDSLAHPEAILASSVSGSSMTSVSQRTMHPERCLVVRPTNPPHIIPYCEIIPGEKTAADVVTCAKDFMLRMGQSPTVVNKEVYGFVLNRLQFALIGEAIWLLREGVASLADIDRCLTDGLALRWAFTGPFLGEELNSASIEEEFRKYGESFAEFWSSLEGVSSLEERDVALAREGIVDVLAGRSHDEVLEWRDRMILGLRAQKGLL